MSSFFEYCLPIKKIVNRDYITTQPRASRLLFVCNHVNLLDTLFLNYYFTKYYPDYSIHYMFGASAESLWLLNKHLLQYHIPVMRLKGKSLQEQISFLRNQVSLWNRDKYILILFPEGLLRSPKTILDDNNSPYKYLLTPKERGFLLLKSFVDEVYDLTLCYPLSLKTSHFQEACDFFWHPLPKVMTFIEKKYETSSSIQEIWKAKDALLFSTYNFMSTDTASELSNKI